VDNEQDFALRLLSPKQVQFLDDVGPTTFWKRIARGEYTAVREGRNVKVTGASILSRRAKLPQLSSAPAGAPSGSRRRRRHERGPPQ
jgi:hypothetical protein